MSGPIVVETTTEGTITSAPENVALNGVLEGDVISMPVTVTVVKVTVVTSVGPEDLDKARREALIEKLRALDE